MAPDSDKLEVERPAARARAVELMVMLERLSREERYAAYGPQAVVDVCMPIVMAHEVTRDYQPPAAA